MDAFDAMWPMDPAELLAAVPIAAAVIHIRLNKADRKWKIDGPALIAKLRRLDYAGALSVVDTAERFWARASDARPSGGDPRRDRGQRSYIEGGGGKT